MDIKVSEVANLPTSYGDFKIQCFAQGCKEHLVMIKEPLGKAPVVRVHSECLTGDTLGSKKCDCGEQLHFALNYIAQHGGMLIYLRQEGRNIGLLNKVNAYALQDKGYDTIEANHQLGFSADERTYEMVEFILDFYGIDQIRLLTNNPKKIESLKNVEIVERIPIKVSPNPHNEAYLKTKKEKMGHML
ncbi:MULTISPECIES: GTP cyclohydrolase II [unclassified Nitratiruptor]|uniref:GTP cyclohydrolase II n=1 Tax=unclassified Nitratiruptor TaxID=2624044 RepID=UPI001916A015|nr:MULTISPECIES: GTP cyclohydrolase II [unclassified Nitratiruptor]BCD59690.1 GTP cyclohydrolase II [Nitratiruptor sp. YY08-10]BCD63614.1 GTP cyclohydrolase II [Nitratiruptor sp. YY08-14]